MLVQAYAEQPTRRRIDFQAATRKRVVQCSYQVFNLPISMMVCNAEARLRPP